MVAGKRNSLADVPGRVTCTSLRGKTGGTIFMATDKTTHAKTTKHTDSAAGHKGVSQEQVGGGKDKDPNNFANDKERASAAGKKGGRSSH